MATGAPSFSYAQAAKGEASQLPLSTSGKLASSPEAVEQPGADTRQAIADFDHRSSLPNGETSPVPESKANASLPSTKPTTPQIVPKGESLSKNDTESMKTVLHDTSQSATSSVMPGLGTNGSLCEDTGTVTPNESDSAWEKVSQPASQPDTKSTSKPDSDNGDSKLSSWEQVPAPQLIEAPLPSFNIWHKRAADAKNKAHDSKPSGATPQTGNTDMNTIHAHKKTSDTSLDSLLKKKVASTRHATDERSLPAPRENGGAPLASTTASLKVTTVLPPPTDSGAWPTPEIAKEEERKKIHERSERLERPEMEKTLNKHHGKEKWVQMPYVPTAIFNTPIPTNRRGGRGGRGGRDGSGRGNAISGANGGEKTHLVNIATAAPTAAPLNGVRGDMGPPRSDPNSTKAKRASSAGPSTAPELRRTSDGIGLKPNPNPRPAPPDGRRVMSGQQTDSRQWSPGGRTNASETEIGVRPQATHQENIFFPQGTERRGESFRTSGDLNGYGAPRERGEGRSDRGRGGFRGRGNFNSVTGPPNVAGQVYAPPPTMLPSFTPTKSQSHSADPRRESLPVFSNPREPRHGRTNSRSQSIPTTTTIGRYPTGPQHLPQLHTEAANMFYPQSHPAAVMSAVPYPGYMEHLQLAALVQMQMEYYFSVDNLCKDMFLRKHMDTQGFVFLEVLANFNRIKQLTQDIELIRFVCLRSAAIEIGTGGDGLDRVRRHGDWQQWVMALDERDPSVRNDGPAQLHVPQPPFMAPFNDPKTIAMANMPKTAHPGAHFRPEPLVLSESTNISGPTTITPATTTPVAETPLSAAVPDFTPSMQIGSNIPLNKSNGLGTQPFSNGPVVAQANAGEPAIPIKSDNVPNGSAHG